MATITCTTVATSTCFYIFVVHGQMSCSIINGGGYASTYSPTLGHYDIKLYISDSLPIDI